MNNTRKDEVEIDIRMDSQTYKRILNNVIEYAPLECGVQTLVHMLLDEIIYLQYKEKVVAVVADLRNKRSIFSSENGGVIDLCIVEEDFRYVPIPMKPKQLEERDPKKIKQLCDKYSGWYEKGERNLSEINKSVMSNMSAQKNKRLGCVEIKSSGVQLPYYSTQLAGHIADFKKVLYTNGVLWMYLESSDATYEEIYEYLKDNKCPPLKLLVENYVKKDQPEAIKIEDSNSPIKGWIIPLAFDENGKPLSSANTKVLIDENSFKELVSELRAINWKNVEQTEKKD